MRLAVDSNRKMLKYEVEKLQAMPCDGSDMCKTFRGAIAKCMELWDKATPEALAAQRGIKGMIAAAIASGKAPAEVQAILLRLRELQDYFVDKSVWCFGGDGWAYDIGYGGLDHVVASGRNVNIMVVDTEVYSNTGGQASKSTPIGAVAKFASAGKRQGKKNLGFMCMSYGNVYVASIAMGANRNQTLKAFQEAEAYNGPSIVIAYAPCIAHGIDMMKSQLEEKRAVESGYWPLYRYNPTLEAGKRFIWETKAPVSSFQDFIRSETRYSSLAKTAPQEMEAVFAAAEADAKRRMEFFEKMGAIM
jgi:pyruvate-ferredoxin/flavodoxin oxidoreductase